MKLKNKYKHEKQKDGTYNIYNVPIFKLYDDDKKGKIDKDTALEIVNNFNNDVSNGFYPRVHVGHQDFSVHNQPGVGFVDNLNFDGIDCFYCDIAKVDEKNINSIRQYKYPYRSVEYDTTDKKIIGLALLESVPPYFNFPILALNEIEKFSKTESKNLVVLFQNKEMKMDEQMDAPIVESEEIAVEPEGEDVSRLTPEEMTSIREIIAMKPVIAEMIAFFDEMNTGEEEPVADEGSIASTPEVVAMQKYKELEKRLDSFEAKNHNITVFSKLRDICNKNSDVNYKLEETFISKLEGDANKNLYISSLASRVAKPEAHRVSQFARNFKGFDDKTLSKYSKETAEVKEVASKAHKDYSDTINQHNEKRAMQFSKTFPTVEKYVDHVVNMYEIEGYDPKYLG